MTPATALAGILALAVMLAWLRLLSRWRQAPGRGWRLALLLCLQPASAVLLYLALVPPPLPTQAGIMTVLTAGATRAQLAAHVQGNVLVALPEAPALGNAQAMPDLATALRRHPDTRRLRILGAGLEARDRDPAQGLALAFAPPPLPRGLVRLDAPFRIAPGEAFRVSGRVHGVADGEVVLLDPAGRRVDAASLDDAGGFALTGTVRAAGAALFALQVRDVPGDLVEEAALPLWIADAPPPRALLLAGAPNPEFRHLRRWAEDAGLSPQVEVGVGGGIGLGDGLPAATPEAFEAFDLVVLDERAWATLGAARREALAQALQRGTGVLLRATAPLPQATRDQWRGFGIGLAGDAAPVAALASVREESQMLAARLGPGSVDAPFDAEVAGQALPELSRRRLRPEPDDAVPVLHDASGEPHAWWRAQGRGRIGLWTVTDSYLLALAGRGDLHGQWWSGMFAVLARAHAQAPPQLRGAARAGERVAVCGLVEETARVLAPDGAASTVLVDPGTGSARCAAYWPRGGGWHVLDPGGAAWPFHVADADSSPALRAAELREATLRLAGGDAAGADIAAAAPPPRRGPSWPWFLGWLLVTGGLWWLERSRAGRAPIRG